MGYRMLFVLFIILCFVLTVVLPNIVGEEDFILGFVLLCFLLILLFIILSIFVWIFTGDIYAFTQLIQYFLSQVFS